MSNKYDIERQERIRKVLAAHAQRNKLSDSIGWSIRGRGLGGIILLAIAVAFALTDQGGRFLRDFSDSLFGGTDAEMHSETGQANGADAGSVTLDHPATVSGETDLNGGTDQTESEDVRLIRDRLVALLHREVDEEVIAAIRAETHALVHQIPVSDDRKRRLNRVIDEAVFVQQQHLTGAKGRLLRLSVGESINVVSDTLIIADGSLVINSSSNNIIISSGNVRINVDGGGGGSLVMAKGKVQINSANQTIISAEGGVQINVQNEVTKFGPGIIDDLISLIRGLFR